MEIIKYRNAALTDIRYIAHDAHFLSWVSGLPKEILLIIIQYLVHEYKKQLKIYFVTPKSTHKSKVINKGGICYIKDGDDILKICYERESRNRVLEYSNEYDMVRKFRERGMITDVVMDYKGSNFNDVLVDEKAEIIMAFNKPFFGEH